MKCVTGWIVSAGGRRVFVGIYTGRSSGGGGGRLTNETCEAENSLESSHSGGGGGNESNDNVEPFSRLLPRSSGGGGNENVESVMHDGIDSNGLIMLTLLSILLLLLLAKLMLLLMTRFGCIHANGVPGVLGVGVALDVDELILSIDPRFVAGLRFKVPLPLLSSLRLRLCRLVKVPPRSGEVGLLLSPAKFVSPTSFSCLVIEVNGKLGFIDGFRLIVPVGKSESNPLFSSDKQPLELELDALDKRPFVDVTRLLLLPEPVLHCDGTDEMMLPIEPHRLDENFSNSSLLKSSSSTR